MAKRNIARTAIEGGRAKLCRYAEHEEDKRERRIFRDYCRMATFDQDREDPCGARRTEDTGRAGREFRDKLQPVRRWLESHVGQSWDDVVGEIRRTFDARSLAGRHVLGHIKSMVWRPEDRYQWYWKRSLFAGELFVDGQGILRQASRMENRRIWDVELRAAVNEEGMT